MIIYRCDHCHDEVRSTIRITVDATGSDEPEHFCSITCLTTWATAKRVDVPVVPSNRPTQGVAEPVPSAPECDSGVPPAEEVKRGCVAAQDAEERTCEICGRVGTRRFVETPKGWKCSPTASACIGNQPEPVRKVPNPALKNLDEPASISCAKPEAMQVNPSAEAECNTGVRNSTPNVAPAVTAQCNDCTRTWTLTGRVLEMAAETHELKHGHIVTILEVADV